MSFVRFGSDGSQVYIYDDIDRGPTCCFCAFTERLPDRTDEEIAALWLPEGLTGDQERFRARYASDFATRDLDAGARPRRRAPRRRPRRTQLGRPGPARRMGGRMSDEYERPRRFLRLRAAAHETRCWECRVSWSSWFRRLCGAE